MSQPVNVTIETLLQRFSDVMKQDREKYRNHVYRVFLNCLMLDPDVRNEEKYAVAAVFHDIGIWSDNTIDYLGPSIVQVEKYLREAGKEYWIEEMGQMIYWHHKTGTHKGNYSSTVETFRKADWIDVSLGLINFGLDRKKLQYYRNLFPNRGFHFFLLRKIARNLMKHPLRPLPMFKS